MRHRLLSNRFTLAALISVLLFSASLQAEPAPTITLPPEPSKPDVSLLSSEEKSKTLRDYYARHHAWQKSLTPEQKFFHRTQVLALPPEGKTTPSAADGYRWENAARATACTPAEIEHLRTHKVLQRAKSYEQIFNPISTPTAPFSSPPTLCSTPSTSSSKTPSAPSNSGAPTASAPRSKPFSPAPATGKNNNPTPPPTSPPAGSTPNV